jgi:prophage endopeptidase
VSTLLIEILVAAGVIIGAYFYGHHSGYQEKETEVAAQVAKANEETAKKDQESQAKINDLSTQLVKAKQNAATKSQKLDTAIATGTLRLRIPTTSGGELPSGSGLASGSDKGYAELDPRTAGNLVALTHRGDDAIRRLNTCIDAYNNIKEVINKAAENDGK